MKIERFEDIRAWQSRRFRMCLQYGNLSQEIHQRLHRLLTQIETSTNTIALRLADRLTN